MPPTPKRRFYEKIHAIADPRVPRVRAAYLRTIRELRRNISVERIAAAIDAGWAEQVAAGLPGLVLHNGEVPLRKAAEDFERIDGEIVSWGLAGLNQMGSAFEVSLGGIFTASAIAQEKLLPRRIKDEMRFDPGVPRAVAWPVQHVGELIVKIGDGTKDAVRTIIAEGKAAGLPSIQSANRIKAIVGLTEKQVIRVTKFEREQIEAGKTIEQAASAAVRFANKLHRQRAAAIAATEPINSATQGQLEIWRQAIDNGLMQQGEATKRWVITPDDLVDKTICVPMDNQVRAVEEPFLTPQGIPIMGPAAHPFCRCGMSLHIGVPVIQRNRRRQFRQAA